MRNATHCSNGLAHKFNATATKGQLWHNYGNVTMGKTTIKVFNLILISNILFYLYLDFIIDKNKLRVNFDGLDIVTVAMM